MERQGSGLLASLGKYLTDRQKLQRLVLEILLEIAMVVVFLKAYNGVRNQFGSAKCTPQFALGHALQVIRTERVFGIFWEQEIQAMVIHWRTWIRFWNIFYGTAHMAVTVVVLIYLFALKPAAYQRCRTAFLLMNIFAIAGYAVYPLMPPRLVNVCDDKYGGCLKSYKFVDTLDKIGGFWSWKDAKVSKVSNQYAAMPSMHAGYSIWCAASMYAYSPHTTVRIIALLYPILTLYCIVVTANHFFLDAVYGGAAFWVASQLAVYAPRIGRGADESEDAASPAAAGSDSEKQFLLPITAPGGDLALLKPSAPATAAALIKSTLHLTTSTLQKR